MPVSNSMENMMNGFYEISRMSHKEQSGTPWELKQHVLPSGYVFVSNITEGDWIFVSHSSNYAEDRALRVLLLVGRVALFFSFLLQIMPRVLLERLLCIAKYCSWALHVTGSIDQCFMGRFIKQRKIQRGKGIRVCISRKSLIKLLQISQHGHRSLSQQPPQLRFGYYCDVTVMPV